MMLLIATTNPGKVREIRVALGTAPLDLVTLSDLPPVAEPLETGQTFAENAAIKAAYYAAVSGLPTVAEDSGLVIDALGGAPGVLSARYPGATYAEKFAHLYRALASHPQPWTARFVCAINFVASPAGPSGPTAPAVAFACEGRVEGEIATAARGTRGFGYDPIFWYPPYGQTLGEVSDEDKLAVSHRGRAFRQFGAWLATR